jgi:regulator of RNase E activity RraA
MTLEMKVVGRAMPVRMIDVHGEQEKPFGLLTEALDQLEPGEVYVGSLPSRNCACWGEILTATARSRKAAGAVVHGPHRDTPKVLEQEWPVFSTGRFAQDSRVRMAIEAYRVPIEIEGTVVRPGDLIFGDLDGVAVIPQEVEDEVFEKAVEKASAENLVRKEIENGMSSTAAFRKYGVL